LTGRWSLLRFLGSDAVATTIYDEGFSRPDNRFIPVSSDDLIEYMSSDEQRFGALAQRIEHVTSWLVRILEQEKSAFERLLTRTYARINPDRETVEILDTSDPTDRDFEILNDKLQHMLEKANFEKLTDDQVRMALETGNTHGMRVKIDDESLEDMSIWVRGRSTTSYRRRTLRHPISGEESQLAMFNRLALITRPSGEKNVQLRLFKDIPIRDVEALLPNARVQMSLRDAVMMVGTGAGAAWTVVSKILAVGLVAASQLFWVVAVPLGGLSWKLFSGYKRAIKNRDSYRARHLYYQNLGANRSALHRIAFMICEEEIKEAALLYTFCLDAEQDGRAVTESSVKLEIEEYLSSLTGITVDFDIHDAVETLERLELWKERSKLLVKSVDESEALLKNHCQEGLSRDYHASLLGMTE